MMIVYDHLTDLGKKFAQELGFTAQPVLRKLPPVFLSPEIIELIRILRGLSDLSDLIHGLVMNGNRKHYPCPFL